MLNFLFQTFLRHYSFYHRRRSVCSVFHSTGLPCYGAKSKTFRYGYILKSQSLDGLAFLKGQITVIYQQNMYSCLYRVSDSKNPTLKLVYLATFLTLFPTKEVCNRGVACQAHHGRSYQNHGYQHHHQFRIAVVVRQTGRRLLIILCQGGGAKSGVN